MGGANESLAPKAVIDWLNGRARGFRSIDGDDILVLEPDNEFFRYFGNMRGRSK